MMVVSITPIAGEVMGAFTTRSNDRKKTRGHTDDPFEEDEALCNHSEHESSIRLR